MRIGTLGLLLWAAHARAEERLESLTLTTGRVYHQVTIKEADATGVDILFKGGIAHVPFASLPADLRRKYGSQAEAASPPPAETAPVSLSPAERAARWSRALDEIRRTEVRRAFLVDEAEDGRFLASGHSVPSSPDASYREEPCVVTEVAAGGLAPGRTWTGTVHRVGVVWVGGASRVHYTADLREWIHKQQY